MLAKYTSLPSALTLLFVATSVSFAGGWHKVSELPTLRVAKATAVVDNKIYLIGGFNVDENLGGGAPALARVDIYDTQTRRWHTAAEMRTPRIAPEAVVFSNDIYVFGGFNRTAVRGETYKKIVEVYDTRTHTWRKKRDMPTLRRNFGTVLVDGKIYVIGGTVHDKNLGKQVSTGLVEAYDPLTDRWEKRADMPTKRAYFDPVTVDGKIYAIGGHILNHGLALEDQFFIGIEEYNPKTNTWRRLPDMPTFKYAFGIATINDEIWTFGGYDLENRLDYLDTVEVYDPKNNRWRVTEPMLAAKMTTAVVANGTIYLLGGRVELNKFLPVVEAYDTGFRAVDAKGKHSTRWGTLKKSD